MAFTVTELYGSAQRGISQRTYNRIWRVQSDAVIQHPSLAIEQVPAIIGSLFPYDADAFCKTITADYEASEATRQIVLVTATYETGTGGDSNVENENPLEDRPEIAWSSRPVRLPVRFDVDGRPIANSAGQPFDPLPEEDFYILIYEYSHNVAVYNESQASNYRGAINNDNFVLAGLPLEPYQARIASIDARNGERNGVRFWRESVVVEIVDDHRLTLIDEGLMKRGGGAQAGDGPGDRVYIGGGVDDVVLPILDAFGNPVTEKVLLDGAGAPLGAGDPVLLRFNTRAKPLRAFGSLGLPTTNNP